LNVNILSVVSQTNLNQQNIEDIFNIFVYLFKYVTGDSAGSAAKNDEISWRSVRWAVRLYFYVCYGLHAHHFLQFIKKKDQHLLNKDFLASVFFYIRLHPGLFYSEKQSKSASDRSLEWRQYCLDPLFTNYNDVIQSMLKNNLNLNSIASIGGSNAQANTTSSSKVLFSNPPPLSLPNVNTASHSIDHSSPFYRNTPLSPSFIFNSLANKSSALSI
jgi:hypothetical protein